VTALKQLELQVAALLLRLEQLRRVVTDVTCQYRTFFSWLLKMLRQLEGQNGSQEDAYSTDGQATLPVCQDVLAFLKGQFLCDVVGPELSVSAAGLGHLQPATPSVVSAAAELCKEADK